MTPSKECDDGNNLDGDGCSALCVIEPNSYCDTSYSPTPCDVCGNSMRRIPEVCDDGDSGDGKGCTPDCKS